MKLCKIYGGLVSTNKFHNLKIKLKNDENIYKSTNVVDLIKKAKVEQKKDKRNTLYITVAAVSALAISGLIISN